MNVFKNLSKTKDSGIAWKPGLQKDGFPEVSFRPRANSHQPVIDQSITGLHPLYISPKRFNQRTLFGATRSIKVLRGFSRDAKLN
ncbi:MAG: hypothetical protein LBV44_05795 [Methylobacillus sp.]|jgi:hypothetical protein|nr:hypothetical protein [Methylobacillus sp.]